MLIHLTEDAMETSKMMKADFESRQWEKHGTVSGFPSSKAT